MCMSHVLHPLWLSYCYKPTYEAVSDEIYFQLGPKWHESKLSPQPKRYIAAQRSTPPASGTHSGLQQSSNKLDSFQKNAPCAPDEVPTDGAPSNEHRARRWLRDYFPRCSHFWLLKLTPRPNGSLRWRSQTVFQLHRKMMRIDFFPGFSVSFLRICLVCFKKINGVFHRFSICRATFRAFFKSVFGTFVSKYAIMTKQIESFHYLIVCKWWKFKFMWGKKTTNIENNSCEITKTAQSLSEMRPYTADGVCF